ncbi:MAG: hypothetical protein IJY61_01685 [Candidatus Gastranaerophilales bacterium]|nr:hypothetical protein [Candidatus Gastranaerophilales bacterium]
MAQYSKLQIRAKILSVISEIKSSKLYGEDLLLSFISQLNDIEDKEFLFDVFFKEFIKLEEQEYLFVSCLLKSLVDKEYISDKVLESLKSNLSDDAKYKLVQLLRVVGGDYDFSALPSYFENPEDVLDKETKKLLENAVFNPESMLDFLDFVSAVSARDRKLLLDSLSLDYSGDVLANIIYPILYSDFEDKFVLDVINVLAESKSSLAIAPFEYLINTSSNKDIISSCQIGLKKLKLSGASRENANLYFKNIIKDTTPAEFFSTIPDGNGNQALLVSRINTNKKYLLAAFVINDTIGVIDCFGFYNISQEELIKVLGKFYQSEGKYKVSPEYVKSRIDYAVYLTIKSKRKFPYEYICWSPILKDIEVLPTSVSDFVDQNSKKRLIKSSDVISLLTKEYTLRWFITPNENSYIKEIVSEIYSSENFDIDVINSMIKENESNIFSEDNTKIWIDRFYNLIYLLFVNSEQKVADLFYTILIDENYFSLFKSVIIQRSIFSHFVSLLENAKDAIHTANIFTKRNSNEAKYDIKKLESIVEFLKKSWLNE